MALDPKQIAEWKRDWQRVYEACDGPSPADGLALLAEVERLQAATALLRKFEERDADDGIPCVSCGGSQSYRHARDCLLASLVK